MPSPSFLQCIQCCCPSLVLPAGPLMPHSDRPLMRLPHWDTGILRGPLFQVLRLGLLPTLQGRINGLKLVGGRVGQTRGADNSLSFRLLCSGYDQFHLNLQMLFSLPQLLSGVLCFLTTFAQMLPYRSSIQIPA